LDTYTTFRKSFFLSTNQILKVAIPIKQVRV
jgi:hypothetical protein